MREQGEELACSCVLATDVLPIQCLWQACLIPHHAHSIGMLQSRASSQYGIDSNSPTSTAVASALAACAGHGTAYDLKRPVHATLVSPALTPNMLAEASSIAVGVAAAPRSPFLKSLQGVVSAGGSWAAGRGPVLSPIDAHRAVLAPSCLFF
jgi:hypothetical protein